METPQCQWAMDGASCDPASTVSSNSKGQASPSRPSILYGKGALRLQEARRARRLRWYWRRLGVGVLIPAGPSGAFTTAHSGIPRRLFVGAPSPARPAVLSARIGAVQGHFPLWALWAEIERSVRPSSSAVDPLPVAVIDKPPVLSCGIKESDPLEDERRQAQSR